MKRTNSNVKVQVRLYGGLGNQLFQYLFGRLLETRNLAIVHFDQNWLDKKLSHEGSDIRNFRFSREIKFSRRKSSFRVKHENFLTSAARHSFLIQKATGIQFECSEDGNDQIPTRPNLKFRGYYQNIDFPSELIEELKNSDWGLIDQSEKLVSVLERYENLKFCAIHVRGGDYRITDSIHENLGNKYYRESLAIVKDNYPNHPLLIFTDDRAYARELLPDSEQYEFVMDFNLSASEEFTLMCKGTVHIIANSTFSYWSARLSKSSRLVICPNSWYKNKDLKGPLYPSEWQVK
jgi:hypothetical protein